MMLFATSLAQTGSEDVGQMRLPFCPVKDRKTDRQQVLERTMEKNCRSVTDRQFSSPGY
jgi:hypothetical protein